MITYQDMQQRLSSGMLLVDFVKQVITDHKNKDDYRLAAVAKEYNEHRNVTISQYQKLLYTVSGQAMPDPYAANYKLKTNQFNRLVTQLNQYLLGNGVKWESEKTKKALGKDFETQLQDAGEIALVQKVAYCFWNKDHMDVFSYLEFAEIPDEEDGSIKAGVRFWQLAQNKPLRATLYELDGYTEFMWTNGKGEIIQEKRPYILKVRGTDADGMEIYGGENYPGFPIVPFWGNKYKQSEFVGMRENIDAYDLIKSGYADTVDDCSEIYWLISNAGGMDDVDLQEFVQKLKRTHVANVDDNQTVTSQTVNVPVEARETLLDRLRSDMYEDFMGLDTKNVADGAVTATQIKFGYEPMNAKTDKYEYCVLDFLDRFLQIAGLEDNATFTRSMIVNTTEEINTVLAAAQYLPGDYVTRKIMTLFGDGDQAEKALLEMDKEDMSRFGAGGNQEEQTEDVNNAE